MSGANALIYRYNISIRNKEEILSQKAQNFLGGFKKARQFFKYTYLYVNNIAWSTNFRRVRTTV